MMIDWTKLPALRDWDNSAFRAGATEKIGPAKNVLQLSILCSRQPQKAQRAESLDEPNRVKQRRDRCDLAFEPIGLALIFGDVPREREWPRTPLTSPRFAGRGKLQPS
jgi:hypothetical protein